ncbi:Ribosomal RNA-processing protein 14 [Fulvia fulva]|nr:Ribosomal RNA-processing protein 14 [Fulvia fulva]KAK4614372.1 Ribosomal RNA-processing protein 14 [Fulvia fulva]WPV19987.1 Ribosomal RNA-processing protein 14 [Fulvia fulva]WPV35696.1 Ribosomal RNA-processing protein 14 [Fulvia fulva]
MAEKETDPLDGLEERLQSHAKAFESLLALTPAREHYGSQIDDGLDPSEQWNRTKQTKEQKKAAKKAKLDPANQKTALDVMKDREKKRKRELRMDDEEDAEQAEADETTKTNKKQKKELSAEDEEAKRKAYVEKRKEKREKNREKKLKKAEKAEAKKVAKHDRDRAEAALENEATAGAESEDDDDDDAPLEQVDASELGKVDFSGLAASDDEENDDGQGDAAEASSAPTSPQVDSPAFDIATNHSEASSSSSIVPPSEEPKKAARSTSTSSKPGLKLDLSEQSKPMQKPLPKFDDIPSGTSSPKLQLPDIDQAQLQERLRKRIDELRARRKADGGEGKPAKSRQELLEQRRKKEEQRKAHKKELRQKAKEEEAQKREEQLRGSGSPLSTDIFSRASPRPQENNFSFSRLAFADGSAADASLSKVRDAKKRKGPQDPRTALQAAEKKQARINSFDEEKRKDIAEKDMWLNAKKHAHGERVRDDTSLLKKALKRKEKQKGKSAEEWRERQDNVVKGKEMKQKKREANLAKRRDDKGSKGNKKKPSSGKGGGGGGKKKGRPGFEGRFKA